MKQRTFSILAALAFMSAALPASTEEWNVRVVGGSDEDLLEREPQLHMLLGNYELMGRHPDSDKTYSGTAKILMRDNKFFISRTIEGRPIEVQGQFEWPLADVARRPENKILVFKWQSATGSEWTSRCLYRNDLNNQARITCQFGDVRKHRKPGLEALFPASTKK